MPGMEARAPERTETRRGFEGSLKHLCEMIVVSLRYNIKHYIMSEIELLLLDQTGTVLYIRYSSFPMT